MENRSYLEERNCIIPLVNKELYYKISDKFSFSNLCRARGILTPFEKEILETDQLPVVAKPKTYVSSDSKIYNPIFLKNTEDVMVFQETHSMNDFTYQEYLPGGVSFYLLFYFTKEKNCYVLSQKNLAQQPDGKSIIAASISDLYKHEEIVAPYKKMFNDLNFRGLVMVEIRFWNNQYYMFEANPRFWGPSQLFCDTNFNFFEFLLQDYGIMAPKPTLEPDKKAVYYWSGGMLSDNADEKACVWHDNGLEEFNNNKSKYIDADIYKRNDSMDIYMLEKLRNLYMQSSKNSNYQILPTRIAEILSQENLKVRSRYERERFEYIKMHVDLKGKTVLDIGGNTGFFSFEALDAGAKHVDCYEGNKVHAEFMKTASELLKCEDKITVHPQYYLFQPDKTKKYDIVFNLNVLHHFGDDFGNNISKITAKEEMVKCLNNLASHTEIMIFQMGFNWKGDPNECLFEKGSKAEIIDFISKSTTAFWDIDAIGIAEKYQSDVTYKKLNENNISRNDLLGEFLNRPIFIMRSRKD